MYKVQSVNAKVGEEFFLFYECKTDKDRKFRHLIVKFINSQAVETSLFSEGSPEVSSGISSANFPSSLSGIRSLKEVFL